MFQCNTSVQVELVFEILVEETNQQLQKTFILNIEVNNINGTFR